MNNIQNYLNWLKRNQYSKNTISTYRSALQIYSKDLDDIRNIKKRLQSYYDSPNTAWLHYNVLSAYFKWNKDKRLESLKELKLPRISKKYMPVFNQEFLFQRTTIYESDSAEKIHKKLLIKFLFETGLRVGEISQIQEIKEKTLLVKGKGNKIREVFHNQKTTEQITFKDITEKTVRIWVKEILGKEFTPHSIRRSFATHMLLNGANPKMVMTQLGHEKVETTYRYLQMNINENQKQYDKYLLGDTND